MPDIRWPEVLASALCVVGLVMIGLYFHSYEAKPFTAAQMEASRRKAVVNCGYSMFDARPQAMQCETFDTIEAEVTPCWPDCASYVMTIHADGAAELLVIAPEAEKGRYEARIGKDDFRRLSNLLGTLALDRRGALLPIPPDGGSTTIRAGCGGKWSVVANEGGERDEIDGFAQCLEDVKKGVDWDLVRPRPERPLPVEPAR
jgi:hypothetical protein